MMRAEDLRRVEKVLVMKNGVLAGELSRTSGGAEFVYDEQFRIWCEENNAKGLACTIPLTTSRHVSAGVNVHPFFAGLLPEGLRLKALKNSLKTSEDDLFTMLVALGGESIGDVYVETKGVENHTENLSPITLESADFNELLEKSVTPSFIRNAADIGIPGVMPKLSTSMISFPIKIKEKKKEYILKLQPEEYPKLIENEFFFMNMAKACGLSTAEVSIVRDAKGQGGLLVTRFDRVFDRTAKNFTKLHQEDACQILGVYPQDKYRLTMKGICEGVTRFASAPIVEVKKIIDLYVFSYLIGNGDLHAKNISLLETLPSKVFALSPCYDLLSTIPYGDKRMAVSLGGRDDKFRAVDFIAFGKQFDIPEKAIRGSLTKIVVRAKTWLPRVSEIGLDGKQSTFLAKTISERIEGLQL